jgi:hypothetical protein
MLAVFEAPPADLGMHSVHWLATASKYSTPLLLLLLPPLLPPLLLLLLLPPLLLLLLYRKNWLLSTSAWKVPLVSCYGF